MLKFGVGLWCMLRAVSALRPGQPPPRAVPVGPLPRGRSHCQMQAAVSRDAWFWWEMSSRRVWWCLVCGIVRRCVGLWLGLCGGWGLSGGEVGG